MIYSAIESARVLSDIRRTLKCSLRLVWAMVPVVLAGTVVASTWPPPSWKFSALAVLELDLVVLAEPVDFEP